MIISNRKLKIVLIIIAIVTVLQLVRLGLIVKWSELSNPLVYDYKGQKLDEDDLVGYSKASYLYIKSQDDQVNASYEAMFEDAKLQVDIEASESVYLKEDLYAYDLLIIGDSQWQHVSSFPMILDYIHDGGKAIFLMEAGSLFDDNFILHQTTVGILEYGQPAEVNGFSMTSDLVTGLENVSSETALFMWSVPVQLTKDARVHMKSDKGTAMVWDIDYGRGRLGIFNCYPGNLHLRKALTLALMGQVSETFYYPVVNSQVMFIDNFPGHYEGSNALVHKTYGRSDDRFISEIWWPDIVQTMKRYDLIYTGIFLTSDANDVAEVHINKDKDKNLIRYGRELFKNKGEIAFHGYNHQPLLLDESLAKAHGYTAWPDQDQVVKGLEAAKKSFELVFPNYKWRTYVPASDLLGDDLRQVLRTNLDSLSVFSGVLYGEDLLVQGFDVSEDSIVNLPRVSSGSELSTGEWITAMSIASVHGVVSHMILPDEFMTQGHDVISWESLYDTYVDLLEAIDQAYPWLEKLTAYDAGQKILQYNYGDLYFKEEGKRLTLLYDNFSFDQTLIFYTDKEIIAVEDGQLTKLSEGKYVLKMHKQKVVMEVK